MYRSLNFKIILIFSVFVISVMAVVGVVLLDSVFRYYAKDFSAQMEETLGEDSVIRQELTAVMAGDDFAAVQKTVLDAYSAVIGIDRYRNFYILDGDGAVLAGSSETPAGGLVRSGNLIAAMSGRVGRTQTVGGDYADYALPLENAGHSCIIYIKDTQEEMRALSTELFGIILQAVLIGLLIALVLSFFLTSAITKPIQSLTQGAQLIASGDFSHEIDVHSRDEIGTLTNTFNGMKETLKNTIEEVTGEREKLETVLAVLGDAVIAFSDSGSILHINRPAIDLLGGDYREDLTLGEFVHLLCVEYVARELARNPSEGAVTARNVVYGDKALDLRFSVLRYVEGSGTRTGVLAVLHDVTSRYELDKAQREFVANVSHELRTPLTVIKGSVESVQLYPDMDSQMRDQFLESAVEECGRMQRIIGDLLTLSRLDNHRTKWEISVFSPGPALEKLIGKLQTDAQSHRHTLTCSLADDLPDLTADREKLEQVVINIVSNSIKYTPDGGRIVLKASRCPDGILISVRDNGIGIPAEDLPRLFERFYRIEKARSTDAGGTGLGLAIAREIVEAHGGHISVSSEVGAGTEVFVTLPTVAAFASSQHEQENGGAGARPLS